MERINSLQRIRHGLGVRHVQGLLLFFCLVTNAIQQQTLPLVLLVLKEKKGGKVLSPREAHETARIVTAFFYSFCATNIFAGYLGTKINTKYYLLVNGVYNTIISYFSPVLIIRYGWGSLIGVRVTQGIAQGFVMPQVYDQMTRWIPPNEFKFLAPLILSGVFFPTFFLDCWGGFLVTSRGGWMSIFYFCGNCGLLWCLAYAGLGSLSPDNCWYISRDEKALIESSMTSRAKSYFRRYVPWREVLTSCPTYGLILSLATHNWAHNSVIFLIPIILYRRLGMSLELTGLLVGIPFLFLVLATLPVAYLSSYLLKKEKVTEEELIFTANSIGMWGYAICLLFMCHYDSPQLCVFLYYVGVVLSCACLLGIHMSPFHLAPDYAGFLCGLTGGIANIFSIIGLYISTVLIETLDSDSGWRAVFFACGVNLLLGNLAYLMFGSVEIQPYNSYAIEYDEENENYID